MNTINAEIVLVLCPSWDVKMPPLGIASLGCYLRKQNISYQLIDLNIALFCAARAEEKRLWHPSKLFCWMDTDYFDKTLLPLFQKQIERWAERLAMSTSVCIGFSVFRSNLQFSIKLAQAIKQVAPDKTIVFGGHACCIEGERNAILKDCVDIIVRGEGEEVLTDIVQALKEETDITTLSCYYTRHEPSCVELSQERPLSDLDILPFPDFSEFDLAKYEGRRLPLLMSRGCLLRCTFCNDWVVWPHYRSKSGDRVFEEVQFLSKKYGITDFQFVDLAVNNNEEELRFFCDHIQKSGMNISWDANFIVRYPQDPQLFQKIKAAGCYCLRFGLESGSDSILKKMGKPLTTAKAERVLRSSFEAGLENHINIITGFPGETEKELQETVSFIKKMRPCITRVANIHPCYITPESILEKDPARYNIILPEKNFALEWYDETGNTYAERKRRAEYLRKVTIELGIAFEEDTGLILLEDALDEEKSNKISRNKRG